MSQGDFFENISGVTRVRKYPNAPGYKREGTSKEAAESMKAEANRLRDACLKEIKSCPYTADEVALILQRSVLTIRPRISELNDQGKIMDSGVRRPNDSGRNAIVWKVA